MNFVTVTLSAHSSTVPSSIASTGEALRTGFDATDYASRHAGTDCRRHRRPRRPRHAAVRLPAPGARPRARPRTGRRPSRAAVRRAADGDARPARPRVLQGARRRPRAALASRLGHAAELRIRRAMSLDGSSVLVTGGTRGIGLAIAQRLVADGAAKAVLGYMRNDEAAEQARAAIDADVVLVRGEVSKAAVVEELASHGPYQVVVHNAATGVVRPALETEDKHWDWTINANARALLSLTRACAPSMEEGSSIIGVSSLGSQRVLDNYVLIGTSKAALESVVRYLAVELAPSGIRANAVSAGVVETGALEHFPNKDEMLATAGRTPAGRLVGVNDIAGAVSFLCSDDAAMIRGQTIVVDGGFSLLA